MDIIEFFKKYTKGLDPRYPDGFVPTKAQEELLRKLEAITTKRTWQLISAGAQSGKSITVAIGILYLALNCPNLQVLIVSPQEILYEYLKKIFRTHEELRDQVAQEGIVDVIPKEKLRLKNGSIILPRGATLREIRGYPAHLVIVDEATMIKNEILLAVTERIASGSLILISTPDDARSLFVEWCSNPKKHGFELVTWSAEECPWHDKELLKWKKKHWAPIKYKTNVLGIPPTPVERAFFKPTDVEKCVRELVLPEGGERRVGIDWGDSPNPTVVTVVEFVGNRRKVLEQKVYKRPEEEQFREIGQLIEKWKPRLVRADALPEKFRGRVERYTTIEIRYFSAHYKKDVLLGQLKRKIEQHLLEIPQSEVELVKELQRYHKGKRTGDNRVDSLCLAIYEGEEEKTTGTCFISGKKKVI